MTRFREENKGTMSIDAMSLGRWDPTRGVSFPFPPSITKYVHYPNVMNAEQR